MINISDQDLEQKSAPADRMSKGPFDVFETTEVRPYIDLGAIRIQPRPDLKLRLELDEATKRVVAVSVEISGSQMQMQAFAAPRSTGLWHEIRTQLAEQIQKQGGTIKVEESLLGPHLFAELPVTSPEGKPDKRYVRFIGVDGPRWFLRAVVSGKAVTDPEAWQQIEEVFRSTIVVRGDSPMPPKELIPLKLPGNQATAKQ